MFFQMSDEALTVWCSLISVTLIRSVILTYLKLWRFCHALVQFFVESLRFTGQNQNTVDLAILCSS